MIPLGPAAPSPNAGGAIPTHPLARFLLLDFALAVVTIAILGAEVGSLSLSCPASTMSSWVPGCQLALRSLLLLFAGLVLSTLVSWRATFQRNRRAAWIYQGFAILLSLSAPAALATVTFGTGSPGSLAGTPLALFLLGVALWGVLVGWISRTVLLAQSGRLAHRRLLGVD
jgi:hypothetical protein